MSDQEQGRHKVDTDESADAPDVEAHRHDEFMRDDVAMRDDVMRDDVFESEERGRMDEAV